LLDNTVDDAEAVFGRQGVERDLGRIRLLHPGQPVSGTIRDDKQQGRSGHALDEWDKELLRGLIAPVQVLDSEDEGLLLARFEEHLLERVEGPRPRRLRAQHGQPVVLLREAEQLEDVWGGIGDAQVDAEHRRADPIGHRRRAIGVRDTAIRTDDVKQREVRNGAPIWGAATFQIDDRVLSDAVPELPEQSGLPDPGFAHDADHLAAAAPGQQILASE
jgi:hypothetical protein